MKYIRKLIGCDPFWEKFAERASRIARELKVPDEVIEEYIEETIHGLSQDETPIEEEEIRKDLKLYWELLRDDEKMVFRCDVCEKKCKLETVAIEGEHPFHCPFDGGSANFGLSGE